MTRFKSSLITLLAVCLILPGCSKNEYQYVLNAPWGYMRVACSFDQVNAAVAYVATTEGVKEIKQKSQVNDMMQRSRYIYTTADGGTVKVVAFCEKGEAIRVFVTIEPEDEIRLSAITNALWDRLPRN